MSGIADGRVAQGDLGATFIPDNAMGHLTCTNCLQKSPEDATRCKHCGRAFGRPPERARDGSSRRSSILTAILLGGAALLLVGAWKLWPGLRLPTPARDTTEMIAGLTPPVSIPDPVSAPRESRAVPAESVRVAPSPTRQPARDSTPRVADAERPVKDTAASAAPTPASAPARAPEPVSIDPAHQRIAQDWVKLRAEPNGSAAVLRVLQKGEVVTIDSLQDGWYRVVVDPQTVGYVDRQYLDTLAPATP